MDTTVTAFDLWYAEWAGSVNSREIALAMYNAALAIALTDSDTSEPAPDLPEGVKRIVHISVEDSNGRYSSTSLVDPPDAMADTLIHTVDMLTNHIMDFGEPAA